MDTNFITLNKDNISKEHICCAFSDKKCKESYELKKDWLKREFDNGFVFRRLDERAKVFIEYVPAEKAWAPIEAPDYLFINCFWVSGQYKGKGYGKALLESALEDAHKQGKAGVVAITGIKKYHFMADGKWFQRQGFKEVQTTSSGFSLLVKKINPEAPDPVFKESVIKEKLPTHDGVLIYYSNRCPYTEFHIQNSLKEAIEKRNIPLQVIKLETLEEAQNSPTPATIFSLYHNGKFITTDLSICMDSRFDKILTI